MQAAHISGHRDAAKFQKEMGKDNDKRTTFLDKRKGGIQRIKDRGGFKVRKKPPKRAGASSEGGEVG